jgi:hypothetical protein
LAIDFPDFFNTNKTSTSIADQVRMSTLWWGQGEAFHFAGDRSRPLYFGNNSKVSTSRILRVVVRFNVYTCVCTFHYLCEEVCRSISLIFVSEETHLKYVSNFNLILLIIAVTFGLCFHHNRLERIRLKSIIFYGVVEVPLSALKIGSVVAKIFYALT